MIKLAIQYLQATAERLPDKVALVDNGRSITFGRLWHDAVVLGDRLAEQLPLAGVPVVVDMPKSIEAVTAYAAIQLSGDIYVPFDPETPAGRRERMLSTLNEHHVLTHAPDGYRLDSTPLNVDAEPAEWAAACNRAQERLKPRTSLDPIYVIFTSGSTGTPKGVTISNAGVIDYIEWAARTYNVTEHEIITNQAPFFFDNSVLDLYLTFACGCTLHLLQKQQFMFLPAVVDYLRTHEVSFIYFVPSIFTNMVTLKLLANQPLPHLTKVLFSGEPMPLGTLKYLRRVLPQVLLSNLYGPTETSVDSIYWIFGDEVENLEAVPLGVACDNTRIVMIDENGEVSHTPDAVGEICVGGIGVALGYWNAPEVTRRAFIQNPEHGNYQDILYRTGDLGYRSSRDGLIYMVGRRDDQIKHMGHRIEPGEIETAINKLVNVTQSCVAYDHDGGRLVGFYTTADGNEVADLREQLARDLPPYMVPRVLQRVDMLPTTANGKVDKKALLAKVPTS